MKSFLLGLFACAWGLTVSGQSYTLWSVGDTSDVTTAHEQGWVLAGGGGDNDQAMAWFLQRAAGGDVLVLRASGSDGYNNYLYSQLGVSVNSVETIRFDGAAAAHDSFVVRRIREAEALFLAGGDQYDYIQYWKNSPVEDALQYLITSKKCVVGGTSAGAMVMGQAYYAPSGVGVDSADALSNPYHPNMNLLGWGDFLGIPWLSGTIVDTHFDQRNRAGRLAAFLARYETDSLFDARGIGCNEYTAVCIDSAGLARVFGEYPQYNDYAYFVQSVCDQPLSRPDTCQPGLPLHWDKNGAAMKVYRVPGTLQGTHSFSLDQWDRGQGGSWRHWSVDRGTLVRNPGNDTLCTLLSLEVGDIQELRAYPNPFGKAVQVRVPEVSGGWQVWVLSSTGQIVWQGQVAGAKVFRTDDWAPGVYLLRGAAEGGAAFSRLLLRR